MKLLKWLLILIGSLVGLTVLVFVVGYFAVDNPAPVPKTVTDDPSLPRIELDDVVLHGEVFGNETDPLVIVIHGGPGGDYKNLLPLKDLTQSGYRVLFYDQRGSGLSARLGPEQITLEKFYEDLDGIVSKYAPDHQVKLIGHSWGAMLSSGYLGRRPEKISHAVLIEPGMLTTETATLFMQKTNNMMPPSSFEALKAVAVAWFESQKINGPDAQAPVDYLTGRIMTSDLPGHPIAGYFCDDKINHIARDTWRFGALASSTLLTNATNAQGQMEVDFTKGLSNYTKPVLLLAGSCNTLIGEEHQKLHQKLFPNAKLVVVDGVGHMMPGENPQRLRTIIKEYFTNGQHQQ